MDGAILSHIDDAALSAVVAEADLFDPLVQSELERILRGRRDRSSVATFSGCRRWTVRR